MSKTSPDYKYLKKKLGINSKNKMISALKDRIKNINLKALSKDIEPFLFDSSQKDRVLFFEEWLDGVGKDKG